MHDIFIKTGKILVTYRAKYWQRNGRICVTGYEISTLKVLALTFNFIIPLEY